MKLSRGQKRGLAAGVAGFIVPFLLYAYSRMSGAIPSEKEWWAQGMNHGPWRWEWQGAVLLASMYFLFSGAVILLIMGGYQGVASRRLLPFFVYFGLAICYLASLYIQLSSLVWMID